MARLRYTNVFSESFTNSIGQTINPGDSVVFVTTGYGHRVSIQTGVFEGVRRTVDKGQLAGTKINSIPKTRTVRVFSKNGAHEEVNYKKVVTPRPNGYGSIIDWVREPTGRRYDYAKENYLGSTNLQLNRVFKIDTSLKEIQV